MFTVIYDIAGILFTIAGILHFRAPFFEQYFPEHLLVEHLSMVASLIYR